VTTTRRHPRSLAEAWPQHYAWRGVITRHRRPLAERIVVLVGHLAVLALFAALGVLLAWRG
jgi:hypothetical protein